jgi:UPF0271 protein
MTIDLNCDLGEGMPHDAELMALISSANIACGGHAGNRETMATAVTLARRHGVAIGAHPGHADREHFGRIEHPLSPAAAAALVLSQIAALASLAGSDLHHVKLHGALYHQAGRDAALAAAIATALATHHRGLVVYALAGSVLAREARAAGLAVAEEAFIDRAYLADGSLAPRTRPGAVVTDPAGAAAQARRLVHEGRVVTLDGADLALRPDTLCIHGDGAAPVAIARAVCEEIAHGRIEIRAAAGR